MYLKEAALMTNVKIKIYSDGADIKDMRTVAKNEFVSGFTTNPSLMKKAGITDYQSFARKVVAEFPKYSISFEVFSNDEATMLQEAELLHLLGKNVYVKIPIITISGKSTAPLIQKLSNKGISLNITAITTMAQVKEALTAFAPETQNIISIFVGRIADAGNDPTEFVQQSVAAVKQHPEAELLWASTREVANVFQAQKLGVDIITVPPTIIAKLSQIGKSAQQVSMDTVLGFEKDIKASGLSIL
ncbi:translaldolase [Liquorilactobacillus satsumensis DSM 16230 = JCM 12392]|uniref:Translaldolase n=2 Tax=Liquorilactobacillus satsumensis TaxID=259059 RepID=A0A0R1UZM2_9LACO|nr:translaldolase [Liquorilactobacillus satsumensis DSM 16230 = JCM 12392]